MHEDGMEGEDVVRENRYTLEEIWIWATGGRSLNVGRNNLAKDKVLNM